MMDVMSCVRDVVLGPRVQPTTEPFYNCQHTTTTTTTGRKQKEKSFFFPNLWQTAAAGANRIVPFRKLFRFFFFYLANEKKQMQRNSIKCQVPAREWGVECARGVSLPRPVTTAKQILYSQGIFSLSLCRLLYPATAHPPSKMYRFGIVCQQQDTRRYVTLRCVTGSEMRWDGWDSPLNLFILFYTCASDLMML